MILRPILLITIFVSFLPFVVSAKELKEPKELKGRVVLVGTQNETTPAIGVDVTLKETGDTVRTKAQGLFRLFLPDIFKAGEKVTVLVTKDDWRIQYPLDGEFRVPDDLARETVEVHLLPVGSKKFWSDDRIEKFIADSAEDAKEQVTPDGKPEDVDFDRYIKDWATKYGFSADDAKAQIDQWISEVQEQDDPYKLGLAAYAEKNFGKASELFIESAESKAKQLEALTQKADILSEETVRDFRLAGDAEYSNYVFTEALTNYQRALDYVSRNKQPQLWAAVVSDIGNTNRKIGIRTAGPAVHDHLRAAVTAFRNALAVYTRAQLPQQWAATQNNLGSALSDQGTRTGGQAGATLLREAVTAYRNALAVYTRAQLPQDWAATQNNLGTALSEQGIRTGGQAGATLLREAVTAYRNALEVRTRAQLPQDWAVTQNNLGTALHHQGTSTGGQAGARLLGEAVTAYRNALEVRTRAQLPQDWAATQNNLGLALHHQGTRTGGQAGAKLLGEAVAAFRNALAVYTRAQLPQDWAMTQNNLGLALRDQGIRTGGQAGATLLGEAVTAFRNALAVRTRAELPQQWAATQNNLGTALHHQGTRTGGQAGATLLGEAVAAFRNALAVYTRAQLPQQWAATQNNLGIALRDQGIRTGGQAGATLLREAVTAYRNALEVYTRTQLPQQWATTQNNLGIALSDQGTRTGGQAGATLLGEAVTAYRNALEVRTQEALPPQWAQTQTNLAWAYLASEVWEKAAESYVSLLSAFPDYAEAYFGAQFCYHERLYAFDQAFSLTAGWLEQHPDDFSAQLNFAEAHFTTGRFAKAESRLTALLAKSDLGPQDTVALQSLEIATLLALGKSDVIPTKLEKLYVMIAAQSEEFTGGWTFAGTKYFISQHKQLVSHRWLSDLLTVLEDQDRKTMLAAVETARSAFRTAKATK